jgi:hypothetical protein
VDGKAVGNGRSGPITQGLSKAFLELVERTKREAEGASRQKTTEKAAAIAR